MAEGTAGAGISLTVTNNEVSVRGIAMGSPAALSNRVAVGDTIVSVNGTDVGGDREKAEALIVGAAGTVVALGTRRADGSTDSVSVLRQKPLVPTSGAPKDAGPGIGIERQPDGNEIVVAALAPGGPAAIEGTLQKGDVLHAVDGKSVVGMQCKDVAPLLTGAIGTRVEMLVKRGSADTKVVLVRMPKLDDTVHAQISKYQADFAKADAAAPKPAAPAPAAKPAEGEEAAAGEGAGGGAEEGGKKKMTKGEAKAAAYAAKQAAKAAKEAEEAAKKKEQPAKEKRKKEKKEEEVQEDDKTPEGEKKDMTKPMANSYSPKHVESAWNAWWTAAGYYRGDETSDKPRFVMMLPPPNVTGTLHIGHALTTAVQDTIARWRRMKGFNVLWLPGVDHAGIATQVVVEKKLKKDRGVSRHDLGREAFVAEVWKWKEQYGSTINSQLRRLGASLDWSREAFTMDEKLSKAVQEAFLRLHKTGLIYREKRLVNWDAQLKSAISDLEVDYITFEKGPEKISVPGHDRKVDFGMLWEWSYKVEGSDEEVVIATTRPETMFGDTAVAVHPDDERYKHLHGKCLLHPLVDRKMPIILDGELVDMAFGTGAVKVTPAHDPNDFATGQKHKLEFVNILNDDGTMNAACGDKYVGMHRFNARYEVIKDLTALGQYKGSKPNPGMRLGLSSRTKDVIEPVLKPQWWVDSKQMAADALAAANDGRLTILPKMHAKKWEDWLGNIRDWCISRQLWWGHRIPAYYIIFEGEEKLIPKSEDFARWVVAKTEEEALAMAKEKHPGKELSVMQDEDVLDTWFSSGLFPFSTLGWPDETADLKAFYPNSLLETGWDILFFWVARMVMMGMTLTGQVPFSHVFLHAMVRDAHGRKMSKSLGNVIDPLDVIQGIKLEDLQTRLDAGNLDPKEVARAKDSQKKDFPQGIPECGTDALRFALCAYTSQGRDINLDVLRVEGYRHFCNKLWNATKFAMANLEGYTPGPLPDKAALKSQDRYILSRLQACVADANKGMDDYDFSTSTTAMYSFFLYELCDVYLELSKPLFGSDPKQAAAQQAVLHTCLDRAMRLLHPLMPFVTEELWQRLARSEGDPDSIVIAKYPEVEAGLVDEAAEKEIKAMLEAVGVVRSMRDSYGIKPSQRPAVYIRCRTADMLAVMQGQADNIQTLCKAGEVKVLGADGEVEFGCGMRPVGDAMEAHVMLKGMVDLDAEIAKLEKGVAGKTAEVKKIKDQMGAASWDKVPDNVKEQTTAKLESTQVEVAALEKALETFQQLKASQ